MAFKRVVEVIIGPKNGKGELISELRIGFKIERTDSSTPNKASIKIYNLSKDTHNKISSAGNHLTLRAGYADESVAAICFGDVVSARRTKEGMDYVTEIEAYDGRTASVGTLVSVSFAEKTNAKTVAKAFTDALGLAVKGEKNIPPGLKYDGGFAFIGAATEGLSQVLNRAGLVFTIQNEMLYIGKKGEAFEKTGLELSAETGLLTVPQPVKDKSADATVNSDAASRWEFSTMLFPEIIPGAACNVKSSTLNGAVKICKAVYTGDNWTGDFRVDVEAEQV